MQERRSGKFVHIAASTRRDSDAASRTSRSPFVRTHGLRGDSPATCRAGGVGHRRSAPEIAASRKERCTQILFGVPGTGARRGARRGPLATSATRTSKPRREARASTAHGNRRSRACSDSARRQGEGIGHDGVAAAARLGELPALDRLRDAVTGVLSLVLLLATTEFETLPVVPMTNWTLTVPEVFGLRDSAWL